MYIYRLEERALPYGGEGTRGVAKRRSDALDRAWVEDLCREKGLTLEEYKVRQ